MLKGLEVLRIYKIITRIKNIILIKIKFDLHINISDRVLNLLVECWRGIGCDIIFRCLSVVSNSGQSNTSELR